jgi:hypothetical protein
MLYTSGASANTMTTAESPSSSSVNSPDSHRQTKFHKTFNESDLQQQQQQQYFTDYAFMAASDYQVPTVTQISHALSEMDQKYSAVFSTWILEESNLEAAISNYTRIANEYPLPLIIQSLRYLTTRWRLKSIILIVVRTTAGWNCTERLARVVRDLGGRWKAPYIAELALSVMQRWDDTETILSPIDLAHKPSLQRKYKFLRALMSEWQFTQISNVLLAMGGKIDWALKSAIFKWYQNASAAATSHKQQLDPQPQNQFDQHTRVTQGPKRALTTGELTQRNNGLLLVPPPSSLITRSLSRSTPPSPIRPRSGSSNGIGSNDIEMEDVECSNSSREAESTALIMPTMHEQPVSSLAINTTTNSSSLLSPGNSNINCKATSPEHDDRRKSIIDWDSAAMTNTMQTPSTVSQGRRQLSVLIDETVQSPGENNLPSISFAAYFSSSGYSSSTVETL